MWCLKCQADVAAEISSDNRRVLCASCGSPIRSVPSLPTEDKTRQARELLERWSKSRWTESAPQEAAVAETAPLTGSRTPRRGPVQPAFRVEESPGEQQRAAVPSVSSRTHAAHGPSSPPHFRTEALPAFESSPPRANPQAFWGQMLAYVGVLALTVGAAFVLMGYFGGPEWQPYAPTGWLITTTGQMLLFLGVVTLVSGGMEQTTEEVARRIDHIGHHVIRLEWASQQHALKGPSVSAENFQSAGTASGVSHEAQTVSRAT